jgi:hypothetical protein
VTEAPVEDLDANLITNGVDIIYDLGSVVTTKAGYPYSSTSGLGYTQAGVSP